MCCSSADAVNVSSSDTRKLKDGQLKRYHKNFFSSKWKDCYAVLYSDSTLLWYDEKDSQKPLGSVLLKDVVPYIVIGMLTDRMPVKRPDVPSGTSVHHLVAIGTDPRAEKVHWFLFDSDSDLEGWFAEIVKTLPKPNPPPEATEIPQGEYKSDAPPPYSSNPGQPQQYYSQQPSQNFASGPQYPQQAYGNAPGQTTVVIDRGGGYDNGPGFGTGIAAGMLGGALLGYGLGSCFIPTPGFGLAMHGFGGGYVSNNDTTINNYYNGEPAPEGGDAADTAGDNENYDGGYDDEMGDIGGGDFGGADFGDIGGGFGDFSGGDFGGGDF